MDVMSAVMFRSIPKRIEIDYIGQITFINELFMRSFYIKLA